MATPTIDETFNDLVAIHNVATIGLRDLGQVRGECNILTEDDLRKLVLATSKAILGRLPCIRHGDMEIEELHAKYSRLIAEKLGAA
jgi:hypothetical protein